MSLVLKFDVSGWANIDTESVNFSDSTGNSVDVSEMSQEELDSAIQSGKLEFDWATLISNDGFNMDIDNVHIDKEEGE